MEQIAESARSKRLSLWVGAGISNDPPASLPLANELKFHILERICDSPDLRQLYEARLQEGKEIGNRIKHYPLEAFVELVLRNYAPNIVEKIAEVFRSGEPNGNHITIAKAIRNGFIRNVLTTNFDLLIEKALYYLGWTKGKDFEVYFTEDHFSRMDRNPSLPCVFKIHGSANDESSIKVTLNLVASEMLSRNRLKALEHFLGAQETHDILVIGYGVGDEFDINPVVSKIRSESRIFYIDHRLGNQSIGGLPRVFSGFKGDTLVCDARMIIRHLERSLLLG